MAFCINCGASLPESAKFCGSCGTKAGAEKIFKQALYLFLEDGREKEAVKLFQEAAEMGYAEVQFNIGRAYQSGIGVPKGEAKVMEWFRKVAAQGNKYAREFLGESGGEEDEGDLSGMTAEELYQKGYAADQDDDYEKAVLYFTKAVEKGDAGAMYRLGGMYSKGRGVPRDNAKALEWLHKAADAGYDTAMNTLGMATIGEPAANRLIKQGRPSGSSKPLNRDTI
jgi:TPR repeat protein